ncbi:hypothetical protein FACS189413_07760 [Bacteroidia bacterium]|nr:hypothetical protein FACS189413_07760 [Bacteroidia bacterium]
MKKIFLLTTMVLWFYSCKHDICEEIYPQGFSATEFLLNAERCDTIITSQRDEWSLDAGTMIDGKYVDFYRCDEVFHNGYYGIDKKPGVCSDSLFTVKYDILKKYIEVVQIDGAWFRITKENPKLISIAIKPNLTGTTRQFELLVNDKLGTSITITQSAE